MKLIVVGAGIGGLATALSLHAAGFENVTVLEAAREIRELGVGINLPPHAVRELSELGLATALAGIGVETAELHYYDRQGHLIWAEPRGRDAGYHWPQYSVNRGRLQHLLLAAVRERLGAQAVVAGQRVTGLEQTPQGVVVHAVCAQSGIATAQAAQVVIGADGIRSAVRSLLYGRHIPLASNGWVMYRGATRSTAFLGGRTMVIAGDEDQRFVAYPLDASTTNWLMVKPLAQSGGGAGELGNWNRPADSQALAAELAQWRFDWLDIPALVAATETAYEYPMADIDPLPQWTFGAVTLLGDAAHAMYPFGSNGASQAILDGRILAYELWRHRGDALAGLKAYEDVRREQVASVQLANRRQASEVMARIGALARSRAHGQAQEELRAVEQEYKRLAGFDVDTLNRRLSWSIGGSTP